MDFKYIYTSIRFGVKQVSRYSDLQEALDEAVLDIEFNTAYPLNIIDSQTRTEINHVQILDAWVKKYV